MKAQWFQKGSGGSTVKVMDCYVGDWWLNP